MIKRIGYLNKLRPFINKPIIKVLTGVRRSGKSVMLEQIKDEIIALGVDESQIIMINFEKLSIDYLLDYHKLNDYIMEKYNQLNAKNENKKVYIFLDEVQNVKGWELVVNSLNVSIDCDIYVTGSNAKLLSSEFATYLAGRYVKLDIYPLSFKEFYQGNLEKNQITKEECFKKYIKLGGFPFFYNLDFKDDGADIFLSGLFNTIVVKDIIERNKVRDTNTLIKIIKYCINSMGNSFSASSISKYYKSLNLTVSAETVLNYIKYCVDAYLLLEVEKEDVEGKETLGGNKKYYIADHSFKEHLFSNNEKDINQVLENIVYIELLRRGYKVNVGYNKTKEIDFICHKGGEKVYYQVCYILGSDETINREFNAYKGIDDNYPKYVLSLDNFNMSRNGITHQNIIDFLLEDE